MELGSCTWSDEFLTPPQFMDSFPSPTIVRLTSSGGGAVALGREVDSAQPFLAYSHRRRTKFYAENLAWDANKHKYVKKGPVLEIPKDYVGWFEIVDGGTANRKTMLSPKGCGTISEVANSGCKYFLLRTAVRGYQVAEGDSDDMDLSQEVTILPGEVLTCIKIYTKSWEVNKPSGATVGAGPSTKFLMCSDMKKNKWCLPIAHPGHFSIVAETNSKELDHVYQGWNLLSSHKLPITVRLAFGWPPKMASDMFSGVMRIVDIKKPDTLVMYNYQPEKCVLTELPLDADVRIQKAVNQAELEGSTPYARALKLCQVLVFPFVIGMKTLDVSYGPVKVPEKYIAAGLMTQARDMIKFSSQEVFPPVEGEGDSHEVAESWSISFRDPEHLHLHNSDIFLQLEEIGESDDKDGVEAMMTGLKVASSNGKHVASPGVKQPSAPPLERQARPSVKGAAAREAHC